MSENLLIIDTAAIINLYAQRGQAGWDALFKTNKRVMVLDPHNMLCQAKAFAVETAAPSS